MWYRGARCGRRVSTVWPSAISRVSAYTRRCSVSLTRGRGRSWSKHGSTRPSTVSVDCAPGGFVLCRCESVPGLSDLVTLYFRPADEPSTADRAVSLSQRKAWLPLREELELARVPFTQVRDGGEECYLVHGVYGGEPIDHAYWYWTQRSLTFEVDGIVCELRSEAGRGPGLAAMLAFVRRIERATKARRHSRDRAVSASPNGQHPDAQAQGGTRRLTRATEEGDVKGSGKDHR